MGKLMENNVKWMMTALSHSLNTLHKICLENTTCLLIKGHDRSVTVQSKVQRAYSDHNCFSP